MKYQISNIKYQIFQGVTRGAGRLTARKFSFGAKRDLENRALTGGKRAAGPQEEGFTLIELLAVMIVMITVGLIVATILVSSLRGTSKTNTIDTVRKNGNYAILQVSKMLEFAQSFGGVYDTSTSSYKTDCATPSTQYSSIKITSFDNLETIFSCNMSANSPTIASKSASLINTNEVSLTSCYFTCTRNLSVPPTIGINFTLSQKLSNAPFEKRETINFQTSVIMRNLNK